MPPSLPTEISILIAASSVGEMVQRPEGPPPDPHLLLRLAVFHRVASLVYERRDSLGVPEEAHAAFRAAVMATLHRNLQFAAELKIALACLEAAGVPVILLKGAHLMDALYHNPAMRPLSDLDLLIQPQDEMRAVNALKDAGYTTDPRKAAFGLASDREVRMDKCGVHDLVIELHTDLNRPTRHHWFPMERIWERSTEYPFEGTPARALCLDDNVAFLCTHAVPHAFSQLIWLRDIAGLAPSVSKTIVDIAVDCHARRATYAGLHLASSVLGAKVDPGVMCALGGGEEAALQRLLTPDRLFAGTHYSTVESLKFRAVFSDNAPDAASILGAGAIRKAGALRRGLATRKQN